MLINSILLQLLNLEWPCNFLWPTHFTDQCDTNKGLTRAVHRGCFSCRFVTTWSLSEEIQASLLDYKRTQVPGLWETQVPLWPCTTAWKSHTSELKHPWSPRHKLTHQLIVVWASSVVISWVLLDQNKPVDSTVSRLRG